MSVESEPVSSVESEPLVLSAESELDTIELSVVAVLESSPLPSVPPNLSSSLTSPEPSTVATGNKTKIKQILLLYVNLVQTIKNYLKYL